MITRVRHLWANMDIVFASLDESSEESPSAVIETPTDGGNIVLAGENVTWLARRSRPGHPRLLLLITRGVVGLGAPGLDAV